MVDSNDDDPGGANPPGREARDIAAQAMIDAFGGIRPMASKLGIPVSTVQGWKQRDTIPSARIGLVESTAAANGITLPAATPAQPRAPETPVEPGQQKHEPPTAPGRAAASSPTVRGTGRPRPGIQFSPAAATQPEQSGQAATRPTSPSSQSPSSHAESPPPAAPPAGQGLARGAVVLAVVALAVAILWPFVFDTWLGAGAQDTGPEALAARIAALEQAPAAESAALQAQVDGLRDALEALPSGAAGDAAVAALADRIAAVEQAAQGAGAAVPAGMQQALDGLERALDGLGQAVDGLEGRVAAIETELQQIDAGDQGAAIEALRGGVAGLEATLADVRATLDSMGSSAEATRADLEAMLDQRAGALERRIAALAGTDKVAAAHQAFLIALGQLNARLRTQQPFADELAAVRRIAADDETLAPAVGEALTEGFATAEAAATTGVPTLAALRASFDETRRAVLGAVGDPPEDMLDEIWSELGGVVTVQRLEGAGADSVDALLATAETALEAGDLEGAVDAMAGLEAHGAGPAEAAAPWLAAARLRVAADMAVEAVYRASMASFRPEGEPAGDTPSASEDTPPAPDPDAPDAGAPDTGASD